jgi:hypothetical protein
LLEGAERVVIGAPSATRLIVSAWVPGVRAGRNAAGAAKASAQWRRRRRLKPAKPKPTRASEAGSGTATALLKVNVADEPTPHGVMSPVLKVKVWVPGSKKPLPVDQMKKLAVTLARLATPVRPVKVKTGDGISPGNKEVLAVIVNAKSLKSALNVNGPPSGVFGFKVFKVNSTPTPTVALFELQMGEKLPEAALQPTLLPIRPAWALMAQSAAAVPITSRAIFREGIFIVCAPASLTLGGPSKAADQAQKAIKQTPRHLAQRAGRSSVRE